MEFFRKTPEQSSELASEERMLQERFDELKSRLRIIDGDSVPSGKEITGDVAKILKEFVSYQQNFDSADFAVKGNKPVTGALGDAEMRNKWLMAMNQCRADLAKEGLYLLDRDTEKERSSAEAEEDDHDMPMAAA